MKNEREHKTNVDMKNGEKERIKQGKLNKEQTGKYHGGI